MKKILTIICILILIGCTQQAIEETDNTKQNLLIEKMSNKPTSNNEWLNFELTDIITEKKIKISDFNSPVLIESFAIWCPTCKRQQQEIQKLHETSTNIIFIGLDTDPNEDANAVKAYVNDNDFKGNYVVSPSEFTRLLIDKFGIKIVNAPLAPVVLICNGKSQLLPNGVKTKNELKKEIEKCNG